MRSLMYDHNQPDAEIECPPHVAFWNAAHPLDHAKYCRSLPRFPIDAQRQPFRDDPHRVANESAAGDMRKPVHIEAADD